MNITGQIIKIGETTIVGTFSKREIVVKTSEQYPQLLSVQFVKDKCSILDKYKVGQEVTIGINLKGREWTSPQGEVKYFNAIEGWNIKEGKIELSNIPIQNTTTIEPIQEQESDLPFN